MFGTEHQFTIEYTTAYLCATRERAQARADELAVRQEFVKVVEREVEE